MTSATNLENWLEAHPKLGRVLLLTAGGTLVVIVQFTFDRLQPRLPEWVIPSVILVLGMAAVAQRLRQPVPQNEPESRLFFGLGAILLGAVFLFNYFLSE